jgi:hypothetical protein
VHTPDRSHFSKITALNLLRLELVKRAPILWPVRLLHPASCQPESPVAGRDSRTGGSPRRAETMNPRPISKENAKVVAGAGGVIAEAWMDYSGTFGFYRGLLCLASTTRPDQ